MNDSESAWAFVGFAFIFACVAWALWSVMNFTFDRVARVRTCDPFASIDMFEVGDQRHAVCRDVDGGIQIREVKP